MCGSSWVRRKSQESGLHACDVQDYNSVGCRQALAGEPGQGEKDVECDELVLNGLVFPKEAEFLKT